MLARLPVSYERWRRLGIFRHGAMTSADYAIVLFEHHASRAGVRNGRAHLTGRRVLVLGPGDSVFDALLARAAGAESVTLLDAGDYAERDVRLYQDMAEVMAGRGLGRIDLAGAGDREEVLERCRARYLTGGLASMRELADRSVDFSWSQSTLEHVHVDDFGATVGELRRLTKPEGLGSHHFDLQDHLGDALNHLRFSRRVWESRLMRTSGFYTNRLRSTEIVRIFEKGGFTCDVLNVNRWPELPTPRARLAGHYRGLPDDELRIRAFEVVLRPA